MKKYEHRAHTIAFFVAILGPLINFLIGPSYNTPPPGMYLYWAICLSLYIIVILPRQLLTVHSLIIPRAMMVEVCATMDLRVSLL